MATPAPTASPSPPADIPPPTAPPPATPASPPPDIPLSPPPVSSPPPDLTPPPVISPPAPPVADPPPPIVTPPPEPPVLPPPSTPPPVPPALPPPSSSPPPESPVVPTPPTSTPVLPPPKSSSPPPPSSKLPPPKSPTEPLPPTAAPPPITPPPENPSTPPTPSGKSPPSPPGRTPTTPSLPSDSPPSPDSSSSSSISPAVVVGIAIAGVALVFILSFLFCCLKRKKRSLASPSPDAFPPPLPTGKEQAQTYQQNLPSPDDHVIKIHPSGITIKNTQKSSVPLGYTKSSFSYEDLVLATDGFSNANLLGQGGFGYVHRGVLPGGREVAVKQLKSGSGQGEREFQAEVEIISRVHHKHLVSLVGYSMADGKRLLVYEFVPNNTLEFHLHEKGRPTMDWPTRLRIALGSAKGLAYLHEDCHPKIIHRDIKAANILVDYNFEPKVSDFGLAKFASDGNTHISTRVIGTFGYLAPEYAATGKLTDKSDVFSFGVMLLELITGRRPVDLTNTLMDESLVDWARPLLATALEDGNFEALVDPKLQHDYNATELSRMAACAFAAVRHSAKRRPRMSQIVRALEGNASLEELIAGIQPGQSSIYASHSSSDYDDVQYKEDMKRFKILALTSEEFEAPAPNNGSSSGPGDRRDSVSSDCSAATSEYGQNPSGSSSEGSPSREIKSRTTKNISN